MQFIPGMGLDAVLEELRRLRQGAGRQLTGRRAARGAVDAAAVAEAILTGRFSPADGGRRAPRPATTLAGRRVPPRPIGPTSLARHRRTPPSSACRAPRPTRWPAPTPTAPYFRSVARIGLQVAEALEYANRQGDPPPRRQAVEPPARPQGQRLGGRLRPGQGGRRRGHHPLRRHRRHGAVHGTGAVRRPVRRAVGRLRAGPDPLRAAGACGRPSRRPTATS